mgnify:CR=1 FL=1
MNRLNLVHNIDIADLMKTVDACKGDVFLETDEGDVLNLKSKFCQIIAKNTAAFLRYSAKSWV